MPPPFDILAWAGIPAQYIMARPEPWMQPDVPFPFQDGLPYDRQPSGPEEPRQPSRYPEERPRPGYEIREPPSQRRKGRKLPGVPESDEPAEPARDAKTGDPLLYDLEDGVKLRPSHPIPKSSQPSRVSKPPVYGGDNRLRVCPSNYTAMEIRGYFGLIDDGSASQGRMLIVHVPSWVRGYFLDIRDGDDIHAAHVNGRVGGVLRVLAVGRHKYYSPGHKVSTCTVCVPEGQWERFLEIQ